MDGERRIDWDRTVIRYGGVDHALTEILKGAGLLAVALALVGVGLWTGNSIAYAAATVAAVWGGFKLLT